MESVRPFAIEEYNPNISGVGNLQEASKRVSLRNEQEEARKHLFSEERRKQNMTRVCGHAAIDTAL